jgi:hypothetical protein
MEVEIEKHRNEEAVGHRQRKIREETAIEISSDRLSSFTNTFAALSTIKGE